MSASCSAAVSALAALRLAGASLLIALVVLQCQRGEAWLDRQRSWAGVTRKDQVELPLYLTPYMVQGRVRDARERSRVGTIGGSPDIESYAGFLTVRERQLNHLFFWFFPAIKKHSGSASPLVLWLQGGPGAPSVMGALVEHGPLRAVADGTATFRAHTWTQEASVVYVDQPVGTGFSHSHDGVDDHWYCANASDAAADLYEFMGQFCVIFAAECHSADFFIAAESYAGTMRHAITGRAVPRVTEFSIRLVLLLGKQCDEGTISK